MARRKKGLEPNLYENNGYYKYRNPLTGKFTGFGSDKRKALAAARKLNAQLQIHEEAEAKVRRVNSEGVPTFAHLIDRYKAEEYDKKNVSESTRENEERRMAKLKADLGNLFLTDFTVKLCADYLDQNFENDSYIKHRTRLVDVMKWAIAKGLMERNYARDTLAKASARKERLPMTIDWFLKIRAQAEDWLQVAMDLALITIQRRGDLCELKYTDFENNALHIIQNKTAKYGSAANIRMHAGSSLLKVLERSKTIEPTDSEYIIHRPPKRRNRSKIKTEFSQVLPDQLSKEFAKARDKVPEINALPDKQKPGIHEIRSLGSFLYEQMPNTDSKAVKRMKGELTDDVNPETQKRLGHTKAKMSRHYVERHIEWTDVDGNLEWDLD